MLTRHCKWWLDGVLFHREDEACAIASRSKRDLWKAEFVEFFATDEMDEASVYTVQFSIASLDSC